MATIQKIRSKGALLLLFVGLALFAFIAEEGVRSLSSSRAESHQRIGEVNGKSINIQEFNDLVDEYVSVIKFTSGNDNLNGIVFGDGDKNSRVTAIGTDAFKGATGLTNIVLNAAAGLTVGDNAFAGASGVRTVTFLGPAVDEAAFGGILAGVEASEGAKPAIVYVSAFQPTWLQTGYISPVDPAEEAYLPAGERVLGVYRAGAAAPSGKAWVCHRPSPYDPKGTCIFIR